MRVLLLAALLMMTGLTVTKAADVGGWHKRVAAPVTPYRAVPRSAAASLVWAGDACWRGCAKDCGRHFQACLSADAPEHCIARNDACDRFCHRECRFYGGPLLPLD